MCCGLGVCGGRDVGSASFLDTFFRHNMAGDFGHCGFAPRSSPCFGFGASDRGGGIVEHCDILFGSGRAF